MLENVDVEVEPNEILLLYVLPNDVHVLQKEEVVLVVDVKAVPIPILTLMKILMGFLLKFHLLKNKNYLLPIQPLLLNLLFLLLLSLLCHLLYLLLHILPKFIFPN